jgi:signal transduction histidine kinase
VDKNIREYCRYLAADIGNSAEMEKRAEELSRKLELGIVIQGKGWQWASVDEKNHPDLERRIREGASPTREAADYPQGLPLFSAEHQTARGPATIFIFPSHKPVFHPNFRFLFPLLALLSFILLLSYLLLRWWLLRPLEALSTAVGEISRGNFNHQVPHSGGNELGRLAIAFNGMARRIREMIASKEQLLIDVSHELRSPLTRARVALEFLGDSEPKRQIAEEIKEVDKMVHELLEEARLESGQVGLDLHPTDFDELIRDTVTKYETSNHPIRYQPSSRQCRLVVDGDRMRIVLRNIIENSLKYSPKGDPIEIRLDETDSGATIAVQDHGVGIPPEDVLRVFEPFYRVDKSRTRSTGGFGLGLSLCKKIVTAHGGTINLQSELGRGTLVTISLPKAS